MIGDFFSAVFCSILGLLGVGILASAYSWQDTFAHTHAGDVNNTTGLFFLAMKAFGWLFIVSGGMSWLSYVRSKEQRRKREAAIDKFLRQ